MAPPHPWEPRAEAAGVRHVRGTSCAVGPLLAAVVEETVVAAAVMVSCLASRCACTDVTAAENGAGVLSSAAATTPQLQPCSTYFVRLRRRRQGRHG
uniref:Uncharacterized protein n=1 Tax=Oryza nivara TaxID=4536 RepID=A0A0E0HLV9_ORYNI